MMRFLLTVRAPGGDATVGHRRLLQLPLLVFRLQRAEPHGINVPGCSGEYILYATPPLRFKLGGRRVLSAPFER